MALSSNTESKTNSFSGDFEGKQMLLLPIAEFVETTQPVYVFATMSLMLLSLGSYTNNCRSKNETNQSINFKKEVNNTSKTLLAYLY